MGASLRVLVVEDREDDAGLIVRELRRGGYDVRSERVETREAMAAALDRETWDLIVADFTLPAFSGPAALALYRERGLEVPFLIVSGTINEEEAVESMRAGAHDFITKGRLARLCPAVARELRDVENRRAGARAEAARRATEEKYRALLEHMPALAYLARPEERGRTPLYVGPQILPMTGFAPEEWVGDPELWARQIHPDDRARVDLELARAAREGTPFTSEYRLRRRDGRLAWWRDEARAQPQNGGPKVLHGFVLDITERKHAEEELQRQREALYQNEKLAAMGQLLAGVAHELNNPLSVVMGQASLLRRAIPEGPAQERAEKILKASESCVRIVKSFLALARQHPPERGRVAVEEVVREAAELVSYSLRVDGIELDLGLDQELPLLWADGHQLQQVLINLLTNAQQALRGIPPPRRLGVSCRHDAERGRVILRVADNGPGVAPEIQARIFDPFFTTKPSGQGTGLGLSLCRGIVESHGGSLSIESKAGEGAVFKVELPVGAPDSPPSEPGPETIGAASARSPASILVVDDEAHVADVLADLLGGEGHRVETAVDGLAALEKLAERPFDLVLSDLRMPRLDGPGLYREVARTHPGLEKRFVFMTGDALGPETRVFLEASSVPHLTKPFAFAEVLRMVAEVLGRRP